jgi:hypothetical protein
MKAAIGYRIAGVLVALAILAFGVVKVAVGFDALFGEEERQTITLPATGCDPVTGAPSQFPSSSSTGTCPSSFSTPSSLSTP